MKKTTSAQNTDYQYICRNDSIFQGYAVKYAEHLYVLIPRALSANVITVAGFILIVLGALIAGNVINIGSETLKPLLVCICVHLFLMCNLLDGIHARKTGTASPLGDFISHYFGFAGVLPALFSLVLFMPYLLPAVAAFGTIGVMIGIIGIFYARYHQKVLTFGRISHLEALIFFQIYLLSQTIEGIRHFWQMEVYNDITPNTVIIGLVGLVSLFIGISSITKSAIFSKIDSHLIVFLIIYGYINTILYPGALTPIYLAGLVIPPMIYAGELLEHYLIVEPLRKPLAIAALIIIYLNFFLSSFEKNAENTNLYNLIAISMLIGLMAVGFIRAVKKFKPYWIWFNPKASR